MEIKKDKVAEAQEVLEQNKQEREAIESHLLPKFESLSNSKVTYGEFSARLMADDLIKAVKSSPAVAEYFKMQANPKRYTKEAMLEARVEATMALMQLGQMFYSDVDSKLRELMKGKVVFQSQDNLTATELKRQSAIQYTMAFLQLAQVQDIEKFVDVNADQLDILSLIVLHLKKQNTSESLTLLVKVKRLIKEGKDYDKLEALESKYETYKSFENILERDRIIFVEAGRAINIDKYLDSMGQMGLPSN